MTAPYFAEHDVTLWQGDAAEVLSTLPAESVNCVVTSPPYFGLRDYGHDGQIGLEGSPGEYIAALVAVFAQIKRVLAADGVVWLNIGDSYSTYAANCGASTGIDKGRDSARKAEPRGRGLSGDRPQKNLLGIPWRVAFALQDDGWTLRNAAIWHKPNAMPESVTDRLSTRHENLFLLSKRARYWFDLDAIREPHGERTGGSGGSYTDPSLYTGGSPHSGLGIVRYHENGKNPGDVWTITTQPFAGAHFATMPPALVRRCILAGCPTDGTVLDPFSGSGTTAMVARQLGRKAVGIELNPDYLALSTQRIGDTPFDFGGAA